MIAPEDDATSIARLNRKFRLKFLLDRVLALALLPLVAVAAAGAWLAMVLEARRAPETLGPLLYREERWSQGRPFQILKFRTARAGQAPGTVGQLTRTGLLLKRFYLDELPQVLNILAGEMTWVGPRPNTPENARREIEQEGMRSKLLLRAGLVGLVQAHKGEAADRQRYRALEDEYLEEVLRLGPVGVVLYDLRLMGETVPLVLRGEGL